MVLERPIAPNMLFLDCCSHGKANQINQVMLVGPILMDLTKACDCIPHEFLIAKLDAFRLRKNSLNLIADYLSGKKAKDKNRLCVQ